jgi:DNA (cytosine-5)-methyltransferase 1
MTSPPKSTKKENENNLHLIMQKPIIFSFFSGAGFLDLGFEQAGFEIGFVNEIHKPFLVGYKHSRQKLGLQDPVHGYFDGDIADCLNGTQGALLTRHVESVKKQSRFLGFIGGPPCPDFSVAGKNRGKEGENGKLSKTYIDLICQQRPDFFIFENVKGLYRTARHREFFESLKKKLKTAGYSCTERLINSIEYGAPQDRERIILFGVLKSSVKIDPLNFKWLAYAKYNDRKAFDFPWPVTDPIEIKRAQPTTIPADLTVQYWFDQNDVANHPNATHQFVPRAGLVRFKTVDEGDDSKKSYKRLHRWRYSPTAAYGNNEVHIHPWLPRRISVAEALAIQSLPKEFELPASMTLSNMFKTVGNGVPFLAALGIAKAIKDFLPKVKK